MPAYVLPGQSTGSFTGSEGFQFSQLVAAQAAELEARVGIEPSGVGFLRLFPRNALLPWAEFPPHVALSLGRLGQGSVARQIPFVQGGENEGVKVFIVEPRIHGVGARKDGQLHSTMPPPSFIRSTSEGPRFSLSSCMVRLQVRIVSDMSL